MKYYAYIRNMTFAKYSLEHESYNDEDDDTDKYMQSFLQDIGTTEIITELQPYHKQYDMFWCYVEIKEGWSVKLLSPL